MKDQRTIETVWRELRGGCFTDEDGEEVSVSFHDPVTDFSSVESLLPCPIPDELRFVLFECSAIEGLLEPITFPGENYDPFDSGLFAHGFLFAGDGFGNHWLADLDQDSTVFGPIYFVCHDAPVILYQSDCLADFLAELVAMHRPPYKSLIDDVHEDRIAKVWTTNPGVLEQEEALNSKDEVLREFAASLEESYQLIDLRGAKPGEGFSWGRYGPKTELRRHGRWPIFAYKRVQRNFLQKIFGF